MYKILLNCPLLHMYCTNWKTVVFLTVLLLTRAVAECCTGTFRTKAFAPSGGAFLTRTFGQFLAA